MDENNTIMVLTPTPTLAASDVDLRFFWEFGDGTTAAGQRVRHRYSQPGNYTVTLTAFIMADTPCETVGARLPGFCYTELRTRTGPKQDENTSNYAGT